MNKKVKLLNTGCFLIADITSGINESPLHCSSKVVVLYKYNSEVYNFIHTGCLKISDLCSRVCQTG